jgi:hypothetical protein
MTGGLLQLVAYGSQDLYLTGNPQVSFFKVVYRRHTNFSMEYVVEPFITLPNFSTTENIKVKAKIERHADLVYDIYVVVDIPDIYSSTDERFQWIENLGEYLVYSAEITVEGQQLDIQYSRWLNIFAQLTINKSRRHSYNKMIGNTADMTNPNPYQGSFAPNTPPTIHGRRLYIPLPFWFCLNPGLAIPLIALQYTELYVNIEFRRFNDLFTMWYGVNPETLFTFAKTGGNAGANVDYQLFQEIEKSPLVSVTANELVNSLEVKGANTQNYFWYFVNGTGATNQGWVQNSNLLINYIYLDVDERRRFAQITHEYLITQIQDHEFDGLNGYGAFEFKIQHPVRELIFATQRDDVYTVNERSNYSNCLYHHNFANNGFVKNLLDFREEVQFQENNIGPCLDANPSDFVNDSEAFNLNNQNILLSGVLKLNGHERYAPRDVTFYNALEPFKYHTNSPDIGVNIYSFGLRPEEFQPNGTCNFSRINKAQFFYHLRNVVNSNVKYKIYLLAPNFNVFRIMGGIGELVFAN